MYKVIQKAPTAEQVKAFGMVERHEDAFVDYKIALEALSAEQKQALETLFPVISGSLERETELTLAVPSEV